MIKNNIILFFMLCMSIFCMPVYGNELQQKNVNIVFAVDCSNSMNFNDKQNLILIIICNKRMTDYFHVFINLYLCLL